MTRLVGYGATALVMAWVIAHLLYLGPIRDATELTLAWLITLGAASSLIAAVTVLLAALVLGGGSPAWLRFVETARTAATVIGCALVVVGLLHYRDTEPRGEVRWIAVGVAVLLGAGIVHAWIVRTRLRFLR
jgi:fermentation-respiration switch protein FrsA (DUF1100 family)